MSQKLNYVINDLMTLMCFVSENEFENKSVKILMESQTISIDFKRGTIIANDGFHRSTIRLIDNELRLLKRVSLLD